MFRYDETDPRLLIAYDVEEADLAGYRDLMARWIARLEAGMRFGVVLVSEHHHDEDEHDHHEHERNAEFEEAFSRLLSTFRRDYREQAGRFTVAFARVLPHYPAFNQPDSAEIAEARASADRTARYMWGIPGSVFGTLSEARAWVLSQFDHVPDAPLDAPAPRHEAGQVGLFYGSTTGMTEVVALQIEQAWADMGLAPITAQNIGEVKDLSVLLTYDCLILGLSTWNIGQLQDDWDIAFDQLDSLDFSGKSVALFGVGDQYGYPDNYLDAVGILGHKLLERGALLGGFWDTAGYEFTASRALLHGKFMGRALDEEHQSDQTPQRITRWLAQLAQEWALHPAHTV
jgi:flavodoxin I